MTRPFLSALMLGTAMAALPAAAQVAPASQADDTAIIVTGERPSTEASAGTKSAAPLAETPQSISVISAAEIADLGLANLNQALRFVAGVTTEQRGASAEVYDQFKLRGFDAPQFLDGLKLIEGAGYLSPQIDVSRLDRVEVVKGPASVLYGQSGPGGLVALSSKLPLDRDVYGAVSGTYGTYDLYRADADVGGRAGSSVLWRVYGSVNGAHTQQQFNARERQTISGAVTLNAGHATTLTLLGAYSHDPQNGNYGVFPASGTFIANPNGALPTDRDFGERDNIFAREQAAGTYILNHDFGAGWNFRGSGRYQHATSNLGLVYAAGPLLATDLTQRSFTRASYSTRERSDGWVFDNQLHGAVTTGPVKHDLLFGVDYQTSKASYAPAFGTATVVDGYAPVYGTMAVPLTPDTVPDGGPVTVQRPLQQQAGLYAQDELSWGGLRVVLGGRHDWARQRSNPGADTQVSRKFTYRVAGLYTTSFGLAPYASYATSFQPQNATVQNADGTFGLADPSLGKQIEVGAKYTVPGTKILVTGAWFRIDQSNVLTYLPTFVALQNGKVRSTGVEVEATVPLPYDFAAKLAYSRQKVRTLEDAIPANVGRGILGVGRGGVSANLEWAPTKGAWQGFAIGGAVRHVDSIFAGAYTNPAGVTGAAQSTPGFTLFDALVRYDLGKIARRLQGLSLAINAANLFDRKYVSTCYLDYAWCWYGNRRTVQGTVAFRW
ncbi:TonB-dependent siderophore receptor [Sphingomonas sp. PAMC 26617]|uniref:TonB-dependent siderophore receptor n=1 Tax=Sphingomonas sp. PAMC 26617 TaxID=1112216 RepID=UPI000289D1EA|nr:TonB-dependent siderophore receptor [Sphingomonas sp. PAMC 26617]